ncbi:MAG TPA: pilus assembly protein TadG-related protein, partial [Novosphingobium sp.]
MSKPTLPTLAARVSRFCRSLRLDSRGNVLIILGFAMIPMTFAAGFGVDYSRAMKLRTRMNAAADAAALAAVNVKMMQRTDADATAAARTMFNSQVAGLQGMNYDPSTLAVDITSTGGVNARRTVTVSYTATSSNIFSGILGAPTLPVNGSATADATRAP